MQFKDLQKSYQVYILYKGEKIRHKMGTVVSIANLEATVGKINGSIEDLKELILGLNKKE